MRRILSPEETVERQQQRDIMRMYLTELTADNPLTRTLAEKEPTENLTADDVDVLWNTLKEAIPLSQKNEGIYQHLCDAAAFAARLTELSPNAELTPPEAAFMAIIRNSGMLMGQKEYFRKSMVSMALAKRIGVRADLQSTLLPLPLYVTPKDTDDQPRRPLTDAPDDPIVVDNARIIMESMTEQQQVMEMAGFLAKRNPQTGKLLTRDEVMEGHLRTRAGEEGYRTIVGGKKILWASAYRALKDIEASRLAQSYAIVYIDLLNQFEHTGFDHDAVREEIDSAWEFPESRLSYSKKALSAYLKSQEEA